MTWPPAGHDRQRELFTDDAEPCVPNDARTNDDQQAAERPERLWVVIHLTGYIPTIAGVYPSLEAAEGFVNAHEIGEDAWLIQSCSDIGGGAWGPLAVEDTKTFVNRDRLDEDE